MKTENEKCGEIYRCAPGKFIFTCVYCTESFDSKTLALDHIENHFLIEANNLEIKREEINNSSSSLTSPQTSNQTGKSKMKRQCDHIIPNNLKIKLNFFMQHFL